MWKQPELQKFEKFKSFSQFLHLKESGWAGELLFTQ